MAVDHFGARVAASYDDESADMFDLSVLGPTVDFLAGQADRGPALEFGIGTGRVALPLSERIPVHGIDLSAAMLAKLAEKPGAERITTTQGDFASTTVDGEFQLAYLVYNTIGNLTTQDEQVACFRNVAAHLRMGGRFVIELGVPQLRRLPPGETLQTFQVSDGHLGVDEFDTVRQLLTSHHYVFHDGAVEQHSVPLRYVWPAELDLMARLAGMALRERWADWRGEEFTAQSRKHVSVWEKTAESPW